MIAIASVISQAVLMVIGLKNISQKGSSFRFSMGNVCLHSKAVAPLLKISFPLIVEKAAFSAGKVIVNSMCSAYGSLTAVSYTHLDVYKRQD